MCAVFSEFEREIIRERVNAGLARAKAEGKTLGRPKSNDTNRRAAVVRLRKQGVGILKFKRLLIPRRGRCIAWRGVPGSIHGLFPSRQP